MRAADIGLTWPPPPDDAWTIRLSAPFRKKLLVELALTNAQKRRGLMGRLSLPAHSGMLFVLDDGEWPAVWMKDCRFPMDVIWLNDYRCVVDVVEAAPPGKGSDCPIYEPRQPARYILEVNAGEAAQAGLTIGTVVDFSLPHQVQADDGSWRRVKALKRKG